LQKLPTIAEVTNNCKNCQQLQKLPTITEVADLQQLPTLVSTFFGLQL